MLNYPSVLWDSECYRIITYGLFIDAYIQNCLIRIIDSAEILLDNVFFDIFENIPCGIVL